MNKVEIGIVQITSNIKSNKRYEILKEKIIPACIEAVGGKYTLVSPKNKELEDRVMAHGGDFVVCTGWEKDMMRKFREGLARRPEEWICFLADDILLDEEWVSSMSTFLAKSPPGQYGFRLTDSTNERHEFGEDWMQFPSQRYNLKHRPLSYDIETGEIETSPTAYVANSVVHKKVHNHIQPFGIFQKAPDVNWSFAIKEAGFPVSFNPKSRAFHLGDRRDNR